jgi:hypothetical protein
VSAVSTAHSADASDRPAERRVEAAENKRMECRAVGSTGEVRILSEEDAGAGRALPADAEIPSDVWISLARGSRIVAKDPRTTRETIFAGPGRVRPCANHREDSWVASGAFESTPGAGETPGAEEWIVTPLAVVRYASAKVRVIVRPDETTVLLGGGVAFVRATDDARMSVTPHPADADAGAGGKGPQHQEPWLRVSEGSVELRPLRRVSARPAAQSAVDACSALSQRAQALAQLVLPHEIGDGGTSGLADAIVEQVTTRRLARAACAVASLRAQSLPLSAERAAWVTELAQSETRWSAFSSAPTPH